MYMYLCSLNCIHQYLAKERLPMAKLSILLLRKMKSYIFFFFPDKMETKTLLIWVFAAFLAFIEVSTASKESKLSE